MNVAKLAYKPVGLLLGSLSGVVAGGLFRAVWKRVGRHGDAPDAPGRQRRWKEVLIAAALQAVLFAAVKAAADRAGARVVRKLTGASAD
ncbi:DUF4235 domain-containing protein [Streptomyces sp. NPDC005803]|uniref:DUF4235 domain-containing protein n=1 Tax=Streptomyces sp. NPDC005803 TaxID=3154297 RepID=UPI0033C7A45A